MNIKALSLIFFWFFSQHTIAMQLNLTIDQFLYQVVDEEIQINSLVVRAGFSSLTVPKKTPPTRGHIAVVGMLETIQGSISSSGICDIDSMDMLIEKYTQNPSIKLGVIQIGRLSNNEKNILKNNLSKYNHLIQAITRAQYVTFQTTIYDVESELEQFKIAFSDALRF